MSFDIKNSALSFDVREAKKALAGDVESLMEFCWWDGSREGYQFWANQYNAKELTEEGRKSLQEMIDMWEGTCESSEPPSEPDEGIRKMAEDLFMQVAPEHINGLNDPFEPFDRVARRCLLAAKSFSKIMNEDS